jgi:hypothetical protein
MREVCPSSRCLPDHIAGILGQIIAGEGILRSPLGVLSSTLPARSGVPLSPKNTPESLLLATACKQQDRLYLTQQHVFLEQRNAANEYNSRKTMMLHFYIEV